ncbi:MAG: hypothetical protein AABY64_06070 [Bdellovibrionota bacterium]
MNIEKFLQFWSAHNTLIIELLIAIVLLSVVYLAFRIFFGNPQEAESTRSLGQLDSDEIQRTLQKIMETQSPASRAGSTSAGGAAGSSGVGAGASAVDTAQFEKLKIEAQEKEKAIQALKDQVQELVANQGAAAASSTASKELEGKLKDLEARLAEYEIISEDIADLSFYREENTRLQKELASAKTGGATTPPAAPPSAAASVPAEPAAVAAAPPAPTPAAAAAAPAAAAPSASEPMSVLEAALASEAAPPPPAASPTAAEIAPESFLVSSGEPAADANSSPVDDELMREFASAIAEQKASNAEKKAAKAADGQNLMGEFENFMKKG